jgi:hypothetical protein
MLLHDVDSVLQPPKMIGEVGTVNQAIAHIERKYQTNLREEEHDAITDYAGRMIPIYQKNRNQALTEVDSTIFRPIISATAVGAVSFGVSAVTISPFVAPTVGLGVATLVGAVYATLEARNKQIAVAYAAIMQFGPVKERREIMRDISQHNYATQSKHD